MEGANSETSNTYKQTSEIADIKANYSGVCRVIKDLGDFTHVVTLQPKDQDIVYKFQMTGSYPSVMPTIIIRSSALDEKEIENMKSKMEETATSKLGSRMILEVIEAGQMWLSDNNIQLKEKAKSKTPNKYVKGGKPNKESRRRRKEMIEEEECRNEKKASMKTADDVIKRILWDDNLPKDEFLVGYIDRFLGIQEKYFTSFSWEDIATVDYTVLAVPKHRIEYFKFRDIKIWDKPHRIDNVFGSTGSNLTIYDIIENYHKEENAKENQTDEGQNRDNDMSSDDDDDDDDDDGITITLGGPSQQNFGGDGAKPFDYDLSDDDDEDDVDKLKNKLRPNYFLALRVRDEDICKTGESIQDIILENEPQFQDCCIPVQCLHVTLCTLGLDTPAQISHCVEALKRLKPEIASMIPKDKPLQFEGLGQFFNRVVYAKVNCPQEVLDIVDHLKLCLKNEGIEIRDNHDFVPHMTLMKITRPVGRNTGKKYISPWIYANKSDIEFGKQIFDNMYLCEMGPFCRSEDFYHSPLGIEFE